MSIGQKITHSQLESQGWILDDFDGVYEIWVNGYVYIHFDPRKNEICKVQSV